VGDEVGAPDEQVVLGRVVWEVVAGVLVMPDPELVADPGQGLELVVEFGAEWLGRGVVEELGDGVLLLSAEFERRRGGGACS
jgi:hypothetical protein